MTPPQISFICTHPQFALFSQLSWPLVCFEFSTLTTGESRLIWTRLIRFPTEFEVPHKLMSGLPNPKFSKFKRILLGTRFFQIKQETPVHSSPIIRICLSGIPHNSTWISQNKQRNQLSRKIEIFFAGLFSNGDKNWQRFQIGVMHKFNERLNLLPWPQSSVATVPLLSPLRGPLVHR